MVLAGPLEDDVEPDHRDGGHDTGDDEDRSEGGEEEESALEPEKVNQ